MAHRWAARRQELDSFDERLDVERANEQTGSFPRERLFRSRDGSTGTDDIKDVDVVAIGELAHPLDCFECALGVCVDKNDPGGLHGNACHEHGRGHVKDRMPRRPKGSRQAKRFGTRVGHEHGSDGPAHSALVRL